jgi:hypothetical protein
MRCCPKGYSALMKLRMGYIRTIQHYSYESPPDSRGSGSLGERSYAETRYPRRLGLEHGNLII